MKVSPPQSLSFKSFLVLGSIALFLFGAYALFSPALFAPTFENSALSASLTVNTYVDTTINQTTLSFGSLDPVTSNNAATENPVGLTNTANSNTAVDIYLNNSNMTSGGNFIPYYNLSLAVTNNAAGSTNFNYTTYLNKSDAADNGFYENLATSSTASFFFWHDVPAGQAAGAYTAVVLVHSVATGQAP